jgi:predicted DNA-binding transcriptional regulator AlpA
MTAVSSSPALDAAREYLTRRQVGQILGVSDETVTSYCKRGLLPPPMKLSSRIHLWPADAVHAALARMAGPGGADHAG